jgi:hypothetical protein
MMKRALLCLLAAGVILAACGPDPAKPLTERQICGPNGCDACVGLACSRLPDGGLP